jgi:hypothetical protein
MKIDTKIVDAFIAGESVATYCEHWIYRAIENGKNLFQQSDEYCVNEIASCLSNVLESLRNFSYRNDDIIMQLFSSPEKIIRNANILLIVDAPTMYDAMVREYKGVQYIVFNIMSFVEYKAHNHSIDSLIMDFLTHELIHVLIGVDYPFDATTFTEKLDYIAFNEGFAHLLSYKENIMEYIPDKEYTLRYEKSLATLKDAISETSYDRQAELILQANSGKFWDKFAAIASMLYLMENRSQLKKIYQSGWRGYTQKIIEQNHTI